MMTRGPHDHTADHRVKQIVRFVDTFLGDSTLTVERISREVHLSPSRVRHLTQLHLGQSPKQYVVTKRLLRAESLLQTSFMSIKEIMVLVGMSDPTHFGREFKKMFGISPREYRRRSQHDQLSA
jgi:AraC-like DNA-binding protein